MVPLCISIVNRLCQVSYPTYLPRYPNHAAISYCSLTLFPLSLGLWLSFTVYGLQTVPGFLDVLCPSLMVVAEIRDAQPNPGGSSALTRRGTVGL